MQALISYDWAGNVRELENAVARAVVFTNREKVPLSVLPQFLPEFADTRQSLTFKIGTPWRVLESQAIDITLAYTRGDKAVAARLLGVAPRTIYRHLKEKEVPNRCQNSKIHFELLSGLTPNVLIFCR